MKSSISQLTFFLFHNLKNEHVLRYLLRLPQHLVDRACSKMEGCTYYCLVLLHTISSVLSLVLCTWYGDRDEFRDGRRQPMVYYCWTSSSCCLTRWISRAKQVHFKKVICTPGCASVEIRTPHPQHPPLAEST